MTEEDIALLVELVGSVAGGLLYDNDVSGMVECHFCTGQTRVVSVHGGPFEHDPDCLVVRARQMEGTIEQKLRGNCERASKPN